SGNTTQRVLNGDTQALNWDRRNKLTSVDANNDGTPDVKYLYDAGGNRLLEDDGTTRTLYLGEAEIVVNTSGQALDARRYYTHPGAPTTVRSTGGKTTDHKITVLQADHHNTATNAIEQTAGQAIIRRKFDPYGTPRGTEPANWADRRTFLGTGIDDPATGLTHIGAREYDASTGRFISADPIIDITDPLQMNGYTYANGNPVTFADPTGLIIAECGTGALTCTNGGTKVTGLGPKDPGPGSGEPLKVTLPGSGATATVETFGSSIKINGTYVPTHEDLIHRYSWASSKHSYGSDLKKWVRATCSGFSDDAASFCFAARDMGWMGPQTAEIDLLEVLGVRDVIACAGGSAEGCKAVAVDAAVGVATAGLGKAGKIAFNFLKQAIKKGDEVPIGCLTGLMAGGEHSFPAGTEVKLADGTAKPIEEVQPGDEVLATDPETGETTPRAVTAAIFTTHDKTYVDVTVSTEDGSETLTTTDHHPFWSTTSKSWVNAGDLRPGTNLRTDDGSSVTVTSVRVYERNQDTFNLTVTDIHTYYVLAGETPVLVHNATPGQKCDLTLGAGPNAREGVALENGDIEADGVRDLINESGNAHGCHTCDATAPGTKEGDWIPDHQPPSSLVAPGSPQTAYPHCLTCARRQGGVVSQLSQGKSNKEW
ncbi:polymorphic toxin-type HINT domain-containing protein, partial [Streptomyces sp. TRM64462]|uniref:polymorphic toxin-type HINT domain-containing protein n=1 Tax=Streptomyces sp. TRM64462 TaxID=2741726 RepID=UPI0020C7E15D